jgi:hypothetical protein
MPVSMPIKERIRAAYYRGIGYHELMHKVFPEDKYPKAYRYQQNGGPPGCAMAFGRALREMGAHEHSGADRKIYIPTEA